MPPGRKTAFYCKKGITRLQIVALVPSIVTFEGLFNRNTAPFAEKRPVFSANRGVFWKKGGVNGQNRPPNATIGAVFADASDS
jgi:hypothetical protein